MLAKRHPGELPLKTQVNPKEETSYNAHVKAITTRSGKEVSSTLIELSSNGPLGLQEIEEEERGTSKERMEKEQEKKNHSQPKVPFLQRLGKEKM